MKSASSEIVASVPTTYDGGTHQLGPGILQHYRNSSVLQKFHSRKLETEAAHIYSHQQVLIKPKQKIELTQKSKYQILRCRPQKLKPCPPDASNNIKKKKDKQGRYEKSACRIIVWLFTEHKIIIGNKI
jgi:hypothetical protein